MEFKLHGTGSDERAIFMRHEETTVNDTTNRKEWSVPYGIVLLPDQDTSQSLIRYAAQFTESDSPLMLVGVDAPPHVTLLHIDCSFKDAKFWWKSAVSKLDSVISIQLTGLAFTPMLKGNYYAPGGGIHVGLEALRRSTLERAHRNVVYSANQVKGGILSPIGDDFRPHVTLGVLSSFPGTTLDLPPEIVTRRFHAKAALGKLGNYGTFPEILDMLK
jgi:2'-5' RNA ligase